VTSPDVAALYLWLEDCDPALLGDAARMEELVRAAARAGDFTLFHASSGRSATGTAWALAVVGESHLVAYASARTLCFEVVSCSTLEAARRSLALVRQRVPHKRAVERGLRYAGGALKPVAADRG
jgi:S-adenosylmethionine/arginine decarboxylase-like enzyme